MSWDTIRATKRTTRDGGKSRSSCALRKDCRRSTSTPGRAITRRATESDFPCLRYLFLLAVLFFGTLAFAATSFAQIPVQQAQPKSPDQNVTKDGSTIKIDVGL